MTTEQTSSGRRDVFQTRLTPTDRADMDRLADMRGENLSAMVRHLVREDIARREATKTTEH